MNAHKKANLGIRTSLNLAFSYHKLGSYNSSVRTLLHLLHEMNPELFESICEGIKLDRFLSPNLLRTFNILPKVVYRLCLSLKELRLYEKCLDKVEIILDYLSLAENVVKEAQSTEIDESQLANLARITAKESLSEKTVISVLETLAHEIKSKI